MADFFYMLKERMLSTENGGLWIGLILASWGIWLLMPWDTFGVHHFDTMEQLASEPAWGFVMLLGSLALIRGGWTLDIHVSALGAFIAFLCYLFIWAALASSTYQSPSVPVYFMLMARSAVLFLVWGRESRDDRDRYRRWKSDQTKRLIEGNTP